MAKPASSKTGPKPAAQERPPRFDVWVCQGRMCTAYRSDGLVQIAKDAVTEHGADDRVRVVRGGCFGVCELAANVVVRRWPEGTRRPSTDVDRLSLTEAENETVYSLMHPDDVDAVLESHLARDAVDETRTREARQDTLPPKTDVAARIRALRKARAS